MKIPSWLCFEINMLELSNLMERERRKQRLIELEGIFHAARTGPGSSPFLPEIPLSTSFLEEACDLVQRFPLNLLFNQTPTIAVWSILYPLSVNYGGASKEVYAHIGSFLEQSFDDEATRDDLKQHFRRTARSLGLPVSGNQPTELFFAPLGPARQQMADLADAFVYATIRFGPPAIEDTTAARQWQRRALLERCPAHTRLRATIAFDTSAWCSRRFEAWRKGRDPITENERHLFDAYTAAAGVYGRGRIDLVGPPQLCWSVDRLTLEAEPSPSPQRLKLGAFPTSIKGGCRITVPHPWPREVEWGYGKTSQPVRIAPNWGEALLFDADTGRLLTRICADQREIEVSAAHLVILTPDEFESPSFGPAIPARDPAFKVAWVDAGETLRFEDGRDLRFAAPREEAIWIDGTVIGRDGSRALYSCDGALSLKIDPEIGGSARIIRMRMGCLTRFVSIEAGVDRMVCVPFVDFGLSTLSTPGEAVFEVLAPGAIRDGGARPTLTTRCWIWPGLRTPQGDLSGVTLPSNLVKAHCAGLRVVDGIVSVDPEADEETPILGLSERDRVHEFHLSARSEKLWHNRIERGDRVFVPRGGLIIMGHENRHDTLTLRSPDRTAALLVLGRETRRPFHLRQTLEIGAGQLRSPIDGDDRIALIRGTGRVEVLARLRRRTDPTQLLLTEGLDQICLSMALSAPYDAIRILIEEPSGPGCVGETAFGREPVSVPALPGTQVGYDPDTRQLSITFVRSDLPTPARATFQLRREREDFKDVRDARGALIAIGLSGLPQRADTRQLIEVARLLSEPEPDDLSGKLRASLTPAYREAIRTVSGTSPFLGRVRGLLSVARSNGAPPRHDLVAAVPWLFEAGLHAFTGISVEKGLAPLQTMAERPAPNPAPSLKGDAPLEVWLSRVSSGDQVPRAFLADELQRGFRVLRWRLKETDLHDLVREGPIGTNVRLVSSAHIAELEQIRSFDVGGGGDPLPARIAVQIERFARACAQRRAQTFIDHTAFRTGLSVDEIGFILTLMIRAGIEIFAYFRALWAHAEKDGD
ncbi:hypothetical protein IP70_16720 [alpha proteobacterium AAP38]|nr:hypothetical protein IP70_16720 [alpha proteobacterium AAP38]